MDPAEPSEQQANIPFPTGGSGESGRVLSLALGAVLAILALLLLAGLPGKSGTLRTAASPKVDSELPQLDCAFLLARARAEGWRHLRLPVQKHWDGRPLAVVAWSPTDALVVLHHAPRLACGTLVDARLRDSRFNAGVGTVFRPLARSGTPIDVWVAPSAWEHWSISVVAGDPTSLQRQDGLRGSLRVAILTAAALLILTAVLGAIISRSGQFRDHALASALLAIWVAELTAVAGYPVRWLLASQWSASLGVALLLPTVAFAVRTLITETGAALRWPHLVAGLRGAHLASLPAAVLMIVAPPVWLPVLSRAVEAASALWLTVPVAIGIACLRGSPRVGAGVLAAVLPLWLTLVSASWDPQLISDLRAEVTAATATWMALIALLLAARRLGREHDDLSRMSRLAFADALTNLPNRRGAMAYLTARLGLKPTPGKRMVVASLDIDHFKQINDEFGHARGDQALKMFADTLRRARRHSDLVARIGGEEFLIAMPDADVVQMQRALKTVRSDLQSSETVRSLGFPLRFSAGVVAQRSGESLTDLLEEADRQLYAAKRLGRHRDALREAAETEASDQPSRP
jgi:diguanylate cyclase (GGDEF)-like protein